eukprot:scaffold116_cov233-Pinguiococcus_pyrenoidosus.AAC.6
MGPVAALLKRERTTDRIDQDVAETRAGHRRLNPISCLRSYYLACRTLVHLAGSESPVSMYAYTGYMSKKIPMTSCLHARRKGVLRHGREALGGVLVQRELGELLIGLGLDVVRQCLRVLHEELGRILLSKDQIVVAAFRDEVIGANSVHCVAVDWPPLASQARVHLYIGDAASKDLVQVDVETQAGGVGITPGRAALRHEVVQRLFEYQHDVRAAELELHQEVAEGQNGEHVVQRDVALRHIHAHAAGVLDAYVRRGDTLQKRAGHHLLDISAIGERVCHIAHGAATLARNALETQVFQCPAHHFAELVVALRIQHVQRLARSGVTVTNGHEKGTQRIQHRRGVFAVESGVVCSHRGLIDGNDGRALAEQQIAIFIEVRRDAAHEVGELIRSHDAHALAVRADRRCGIVSEDVADGARAVVEHRRQQRMRVAADDDVDATELGGQIQVALEADVRE